MKNKTVFLSILFLSFSFIRCADDKKEELLPITNDLLYFRYLKDAVNNTSSLEYAIKFTNPNNKIINGTYHISLNIDGRESVFINGVNAPCTILQANESCTNEIVFTDNYYNSNTLANSITFIKVEYFIEE